MVEGWVVKLTLKEDWQRCQARNTTIYVPSMVRCERPRCPIPSGMLLFCAGRRCITVACMMQAHSTAPFFSRFSPRYVHRFHFCASLFWLSARLAATLLWWWNTLNVLIFKVPTSSFIHYLGCTRMMQLQSILVIVTHEKFTFLLRSLT